MNLQYLTDNKGNTTGVYVPIQDWEEMKQYFKSIEKGEYQEPTKTEILQSIKDALHEVELHKQGKIKLKTIDDLINEL